MRKLFLIAIALLVAGALYTGQAQAEISGTAHDLSGSGWGSTQICNYCHTPHNANATPLAPLWNHASTVASYALYPAGGTLNSTPGQPGSTSKACLSCHDGTVAIDSFGSATGTHFVTGDALVGTNLSNDHPIGITYDSALATADGALVSPSSTSLVVTGIPLFSSKLECGSCHNVHDNTNTPFLRASNTTPASGLCLKCHVK